MINDINFFRNTKADERRIEIFKKDLNVFNAFSKRDKKVILRYMKPYIKAIIFLIILALGLSLLEGFRALSIVAFIKSLFAEGTEFLHETVLFGRYRIGDYITFTDKNGLIFSVLSAFIVLSIMLIGVKFVLAVFTRWLQLMLTRDLRRDLYEKIVSFDIDFFNEAKSGELLFMMNAEVNRFSRIMLNFRSFLSSSFALLIFMSILLYMWPLVTAITVVSGAIFYFLHRVFIQKRLWINSYRANRCMNVLQQIFYEIIYGMKLIKLGGLEARERDEYLDQHKMYEDEEMKLARLGVFSDAIREVFFIAVFAFFSFSFFYFINKGVLAKESSFILGYMVVLLRVVPYFSEFQRSMLGVVESSAPLAKIVDILTTSIEKKQPSARSYKKLGPTEEIKVNDIFFSYKDAADVLKGVSMNFKKGKMYAIVSFSGGGKSTLLDLMANIRRPNRGSILFNSQEVDVLDPMALRGRIGYVNQEPLIFHNTIKENVAFFKKDADEVSIDKALEMAAIKDFVHSLSDGLGTGLGERGLTVSGGERQRIGLARVFLKNAEVLLLDEATNSVDYQTEKNIYDNLKNIKNDKIIIIAAHRLSSVVGFDEIIVLYNGRVEERGVHKELMENRGIYYSLYKLQEAEEKKLK